jgi:hypothetical protein
MARARVTIWWWALTASIRARQAIFPQIAPRFLGQICWRTIVPNSAGIDSWTAMLGKGKTLLALPVNGESVYVYGDVTVPREEIGRYSAETDLKGVFAEFEALYSPSSRHCRQARAFISAASRRCE